MKALKISVLLGIAAASSVYISLQDVPEKVKLAFTNQFPNATSAQWEKESEAGWEVDFKLKEVSYSANYLNDGSWLETEYEIGEEELPETVITTLSREFPGYEIDEVEKVESSNGFAFEIELEKGNDEVELLIDSLGEIISREQDDEDEDED
jgi:hypothetical protein